MIEVCNLVVEFGGHVVIDHVSFSIKRGDRLAVVGRSGSGKSVLIKTIIGLLEPTEGNVNYRFDESNRTPVFGIVFQNAALLDSFSVYQNIALPLVENSTKTRLEIQNTVHKLLNKLGLSNIEDKYPAELSGGMRKRVGIARALVLNPDVIIFDEPTTGLDPLTSNELIAFIGSILDDYSITSIIVTHDTNCVKRLCQDVLFLDNGKLGYYGKASDHFASSSAEGHFLLKELLG